MIDTILGGALIVVGYLCGSLASAVIVCRLLRLPDPREAGSHNPGATNVLRLAGKGPAALTLAGDMLKGFLPVALAHLLGQPPVVIGATALAAFVGHLYPIFFRFKGGKGVATAFGAVAAMAYPIALFMAAVWVLVALVSRYSSLAALCAAGAAPIFALVFVRVGAYVVVLLVIAALLFYRHRENIARLRAGTESEIQLG